MSVENVPEVVDIKTLKGIGPQNLGAPLEFSLSDLINKIVDIDSTQVQYWVGSGHRQVCSKRIVNVSDKEILRRIQNLNHLVLEQVESSRAGSK